MSRLANLRLPTSGALTLACPLAVIAATALIGSSGSPAFERTVITLLTSMVIVLGLQVFIGNSGVYSFGHIAFAAVAGYVAAIVTLPSALKLVLLPNMPSPLDSITVSTLSGTLIGGAAAALVAALVAIPLMRTSTLAIPISTLAFLIVVREVIANWEQATGGTSGLTGVPTTTTLGSAAIWAALAVLAALAFKGSRLGYRVQASRENEVAAKSIGVGVDRERYIAFVASAAIVGVGGALAAHQSVSITPNAFYFDLTLATLTMLIVGGLRSVWGAVVGTVAVTIVNEVLRGFEDGANLGPFSIGDSPGLAPIGVSLILIAVLITRPSGITLGYEAGELPRLRFLRHRDLLSPAVAAPERADTPVITANGARPESAVVVREDAEALCARDVSVHFAGIKALDNVSLKVRRGEIVGLIGPNGAGKTTLVNVLSGFQRPTAGKVTLAGADTTVVSPHQLPRRGLARTFQAALPFPEMTARENVAVGAMGVGRSKRSAIAFANNVLGRLDLAKRADTLAGSLPPGQERLLGIARALATEPRFLLLDEPAAGLDEREGEELVSSLKQIRAEFGCAILLIEHDMEVVMPLCGRVHVLDNGKTLCEGAPQEVRGDRRVVEAYLGSSFAVGASA